MTQPARTGERPDERMRLEWEPPEDAGEPAIAAEAVAALFSLADAWLEPLALELRVSCYDRQIFSEGPEGVPCIPDPFHHLVREPGPAGVAFDPMYGRSIASHAPSLSSDSVQSWVNGALAQPCGDDARFETSLRELYVRASEILLPSGCVDNGGVLLECHVGTVHVPVNRRGAAAWVPAPPTRYNVPQPVAISISNRDGWLRFSIDVYWSPWVGELGRPERPLAQGVARLAARGWHLSSD